MPSLSEYLGSLYQTYLQKVLHYANEILVNPQISENLHQMRTNTRRIRTLLAEFADYFDPLFLQKSKAVFKELIKKSNEARDIDVFLEHFDEYEESLPKSMRKDLLPLKEQLLEKRDKEYEKLRVYLQDLTKWACSICIPQIQPNDEDAKKLIKRAITRRKKKIKKLKKQIHGCNPELLHRLRIHYKRLRYLYEMLGRLQDVGKQLKKLKRVQNLLGRYHDLVVQRNNILRFIQEDDFGIPTILAAGKLSGDIEQRSEKLCKKITRKDMV